MKIKRAFARLSAPSVAGHMPGFIDFGNKVTPAQAAGGLAAGAVVGAAPFVGPSIVSAAIEHLGSLTKIVQAAKNIGWTSFSLKEAHDLYKMVAGDKK